jgi:hypothetical protein
VRPQCGTLKQQLVWLVTQDGCRGSCSRAACANAKGSQCAATLGLAPGGVLTSGEGTGPASMRMCIKYSPVQGSNWTKFEHTDEQGTSIGEVQVVLQSEVHALALRRRGSSTVICKAAGDQPLAVDCSATCTVRSTA